MQALAIEFFIFVIYHFIAKVVGIKWFHKNSEKAIRGKYPWWIIAGGIVYLIQVSLLLVTILIIIVRY